MAEDVEPSGKNTYITTQYPPGQINTVSALARALCEYVQNNKIHGKPNTKKVKNLTWIKPVRKRTKRLVNKIGPR